MDAAQIICTLGLSPHPEGGHYREAFRDSRTIESNGRSASTAIYSLLQAGEVSRWHRVDAAEIWHFYAGQPLELTIQGSRREMLVLGADIAQGHRPQIVVPQNAWQMARPLGAWTLAGCTVAPGFEFRGFELAPPGFEPGN